MATNYPALVNVIVVGQYKEPDKAMEFLWNRFQGDSDFHSARWLLVRARGVKHMVDQIGKHLAKRPKQRILRPDIFGHGSLRELPTKHVRNGKLMDALVIGQEIGDDWVGPDPNTRRLPPALHGHLNRLAGWFVDSPDAAQTTIVRLHGCDAGDPRTATTVSSWSLALRGTIVLAGKGTQYAENLLRYEDKVMGCSRVSDERGGAACKIYNRDPDPLMQ